jgi:hypothetical protein
VCGDGAKVLDFIEEALDEVAFAVKREIASPLGRRSGSLQSGTRDPGGYIAQRGLRAAAARWLALASRAATNFRHWLMRRGNTCSRSEDPQWDPGPIETRC